MKKIISMLCVVLVVGFAGTAFAEPKAKVDVCHNGSVYIGNTGDGAEYDPEMWVPGSFVINISENAVTKHVVNHGDSETFTPGVPVTTELVIENNVVTGFEMQDSCTISE
jgi:hypothetical protein